MIGKLKTVVLDAPDHAALARFYTELTGWEQVYADDEWATVEGPGPIRLGFQAAPDLVPPQWPDPSRPQQAHLDLLVPDIQAGAAGAEALGATRLGGGESWVTMADPAGHPFDLCGGDGGLYAVTIDCADPKRLAEFYAAAFGMERRYDGDEGSLIGAEGQMQVMFQRVEGHQAPRWPDPAHPQQLHLDVAVAAEDVDAAEQEALALGATKLGHDGENWRVYADPAGHPFCLTW